MKIKQEIKKKVSLPRIFGILFIMALVVISFRNFSYLIALFFRTLFLFLGLAGVLEILVSLIVRELKVKNIMFGLFLVVIFLIDPLKTAYTILDFPNALLGNYNTIEGEVNMIQAGRGYFIVNIHSSEIDFITYQNITEGNNYKIKYLPLSKVGMKYEEITHEKN